MFAVLVDAMDFRSQSHNNFSLDPLVFLDRVWTNDKDFRMRTTPILFRAGMVACAIVGLILTANLVGIVPGGGPALFAQAPAPDSIVEPAPRATPVVAVADAPNRPEAILDQMFAQRRQRAPSFDGGVSWINTAGPVDLKKLRGKFVLVDFWTFCCINCMHILPELEKLEKTYPNEMVVVGVHSAKFEAEQDSQNIIDAVQRYHIEHPVVNDARQTIWNRFGVNSWPTLVMIDPEGYMLFKRGGEFKAEDLDAFLKYAVPYYKKKGLISETPLHFELEKNRAPQTPLRFPGKVLADEATHRLFISDSNHNRIVVADLNGQLQATIGGGREGSADGDFNSAQFNRPQGMALAGDLLYVADTENHLIRKVDLKQKRVRTVAGTGRQAPHGFPGWDGADGLPPIRFSGLPRTTPLSSPWDLLVHDQDLFVAMAGTHQIWKMPLDETAMGPFAGNSREDIVDGPQLPRQPYEIGFASFAQPSGLASDGKRLYVADSEGSSIRAVPFTKADVTTIVGTAALATGRLFTFGDRDGEAGAVRMQHVLGVCWHDKSVYVADTYNNKIKQLDPLKRTVKTLAGAGPAGHEDGSAEKATFSEPAGLSYAAGKLYVADTNSHLIRVVALGDEPRVSTLEIKGLTPPVTAVPVANKRPTFDNATQIKLAETRLKPRGDSVHLSVKFVLPEGFHINAMAPMRYWLDAPGVGPIDRSGFDKSHKLEMPAAEFDVVVPLKQAAGNDTLTLSMNYYYCQAGAEGVCKVGSVVWTVPIVLDATAKMSAAELSVSAPK